MHHHLLLIYLFTGWLKTMKLEDYFRVTVTAWSGQDGGDPHAPPLKRTLYARQEKSSLILPLASLSHPCSQGKT